MSNTITLIHPTKKKVTCPIPENGTEPQTLGRCLSFMGGEFNSTSVAWFQPSDTGSERVTEDIIVKPGDTYVMVKETKGGSGF